MKGNVLLLGFGMQGKAAFYDLINSDDVSSVTVVDINPNLEKEIEQYQSPKAKAVTLSIYEAREIRNLMRHADVVVDLLPYKFTFQVLIMAVEVGVNLVSAMSYYDGSEQDENKKEQREEELESLQEVAKEKGIVLLFEFGMDPGLNLVIGKRAARDFDEVHHYKSYGAGFPELSAANNPLKYKFTYSLEGVMATYHRSAVIIRNGKTVEIPASEIFAPENTHLLNLDVLGGSLECFANGNADYCANLMGIRNKLQTMGKYFCRWEGHAAFWEAMSKAGFLNDSPIQVNGTEISPMEFCTTLLGGQSQFYYSEKERDVVLIRIEIKGIKDGKEKEVVYQVIDYRDLETGFTAMARTAGFTAAMGAKLIMQGKVNKKGIITPLDVNYDDVASELAKWGIKVTIQ